MRSGECRTTGRGCVGVDRGVSHKRCRIVRGRRRQAACVCTDFNASVEMGTRVSYSGSEPNTASRRAAEKAGAQFECVARSRLQLKGRSYPAAVYSLIKSDLY